MTTLATPRAAGSNEDADKKKVPPSGKLDGLNKGEEKECTGSIREPRL